MYKITYFENNSDTIQIMVFKGENAYNLAILWGKKYIRNFDSDIITEIN
jgi:hypothetical protein